MGVRYNRARLIGCGELILAFGSFLTASPYFIYGPAKHLLSSSLSSSNGTNFEMCSAIDYSTESCDNNQGATVWPAVIILVLGSWFRGMGYTCYFVVGLPYLDDNIKKESSAIMISIMQAIRLVGPACRFILGSFCLSFYEDPFCMLSNLHLFSLLILASYSRSWFWDKRPSFYWRLVDELCRCWISPFHCGRAHALFPISIQECFIQSKGYSKQNQREWRFVDIQYVVS